MGDTPGFDHSLSDNPHTPSTPTVPNNNSDHTTRLNCFSDVGAVVRLKNIVRESWCFSLLAAAGHNGHEHVSLDFGISIHRACSWQDLKCHKQGQGLGWDRKL